MPQDCKPPNQFHDQRHYDAAVVVAADVVAVGKDVDGEMKFLHQKLLFLQPQN